MKLSVSAYRAHASAHKKILDTAYQLNYGSTQASSAGQLHQHYKVEPLSSDDPHPHPLSLGAPGGGTLLTADNSGSDTPATSPRSPLNTSRDEDDDSSNAASSDCKSPNQRYVGSDSGASADRSGSRVDVDSGAVGGGSLHGSLQSVADATAKAATQSWRNIRAVMAYYHTLRKIKRTKSNQRWMKLRTTVQLSSAIQKKPPLKREDSFLKRFSTRQIPETQETVEDTGSEGGGAQQTAPRRRRRPAKLPRTVVNPDENFYFYWLLALTICVLYNMWALIVRQSFPEFQSMASGFWMVCDAVSDVVFLLDVGVQLRTGYLEQGLMVYDSRKLAGHYLHSRAFLLDLGALCPLDLLQVRFGPQPMLRFPRFLKVYRAVNYYYMVESRTVWPNLWRVVNLIHILLILAHWFGCFYFLLSEAEGFQGDWVYPYRPGDYATLTRKYLGSLYWSTLTLTTIGDLPTPETNAEHAVTVDGPKSLPRRGLKSRLLQFNTDGGYVFTIVSYLIGVFIFATIVGQVGNVITNRNANRLEFERLLDGAKTYMRHHKVPSGMKKRVLRWYDYSWSRGRIQGGGDINTALGLLPDKLKTELALHVNLSVLKKVTIFQECQPEFLHDLVLKMKAYIFTPGDSICRKGEVAREMFIIADGILEVLSETGRVLTTMKAGDFFGEIGILNLDGLNKRTADVRSVGYSELFSLSREDVLAAMKDYPEAQEILQALGRKRLMEVRNSARQHGPSRASSKHHRSQGHGDAAGPHPSSPDHARTLVSKLKSEAKGLRNALRKSRARRSDESLELQPLHGGPSPPKHPLRRMPRVRSDEDGDEPTGEPVVSPLGAGLPLLSRLRLLKEKQDNEDRVTSPGSIVSPPGTAGLAPDPGGDQHQQPHEPEVIGAGLPLLQRLLLLKAKEDRDRTQASGGGGPAAGGGAGVGTSGGGIERRSRSPSPALSPSQKTVAGKVSFRDRIFAVRATTTISIPDSPKKSPLHPSSPPFIEEPPCASTPDVVRDTRDSNPPPETQPLLQPGTSSDTDPWSKLKQAAIVRDSSVTNLPENTVPSTNVVSANVSAKRTKPSLLQLQSRNKQYESIDDLSPEYCGLPFVKKLKILNERQKLAELESAMTTRSVSLDIPDSQQPYDDSTLTRSHSEASAMHRRNSSTVRLTVQHVQPPTSPESNETPERRNLKSILKKLSEDARPKPKRNAEDNRSTASNSDLRQLLRAPTIEGYAARHSKLAKSVTFDRDTLPSPPGGPPVPPAQPAPPQDAGETGGAAVVTIAASPPPEADVVAGDKHEERNGVGELPTVVEETERREERREERVVVPTGGGNQVKLIKPSLDEHEYFGTALVAIKQVISAHLQEMQHKFQQRFDRLEAEVRSRDAVIGRLRQHIHDLERSLDEDYTGSDSADTVITRPNRSWDDSSNQESLELQELPESMRPQRAWSPSPDSVVLDLDTTDTESEMDSDPERDNFTHNANWEVEMLAAQMRQQRRSASFDQNAAPRRRLLCRGYSADAGGRD